MTDSIRKEIVVGSHRVVVEVRPNPSEPNVIDFVATCGQAKREHRQSLHPNHERTDAQFQKDIEEAIQQLAKETAGHEHSRAQREAFFKT